MRELHFVVHAFESADEAEEFAAGTVLEDIIEPALLLEGGMQSDDEWMMAVGLNKRRSTRI